MALESGKQHYERLQEEKKSSLKSSAYHLDIISALSIINRHATNIARSLIASSK